MYAVYIVFIIAIDTLEVRPDPNYYSSTQR